MSHTPGPWTFDPEDVASSFQIYPSGSFLEPWIADVKGEHVGPKTRAEVIANAHLISAAPDLLAALKALLPEGWGDDDTMDHIPGVKQARAAIAKAEGTAP